MNLKHEYNIDGSKECESVFNNLDEADINLANSDDRENLICLILISKVEF